MADPHSPTSLLGPADPWPVSDLIPGGHQLSSGQADARRTMALSSLVTGVGPDNLLQAIASEQGSLKTMPGPGLPRRTLFWPVTDSDVLANPGRYNGGSTGQVKTIATWRVDAQVGDDVNVVNFRYRYAAYPRLVSHIEESVVSLTQDLIDQFGP